MPINFSQYEPNERYLSGTSSSIHGIKENLNQLLDDASNFGFVNLLKNPNMYFSFFGDTPKWWSTFGTCLVDRHFDNKTTKVSFTSNTKSMIYQDLLQYVKKSTEYTFIVDCVVNGKVYFILDNNFANNITDYYTGEFSFTQELQTGRNYIKITVDELLNDQPVNVGFTNIDAQSDIVIDKIIMYEGLLDIGDLPSWNPINDFIRYNEPNRYWEITDDGFNWRRIATELDIHLVRNGAAYKPDPVRLVSNENINLYGNTIIDGVVTSKNDRIMVAGQEDRTKNGIYIVNDMGLWTRAEDFNDEESTVPGSIWLVTEGSMYADTQFIFANDTIPVLETDNINFIRFIGLDWKFKDGLVVGENNTVNVTPKDRNNLQVGPGWIDLAKTGVYPGTYSQVDVDEYGRVINGVLTGSTCGSRNILRWIDVLEVDMPTGTRISLPSGLYYRFFKNSLEVYFNGVRLIRNIDYHEIDPTSIELLIPVKKYDLIELFERVVWDPTGYYSVKSREIKYISVGVCNLTKKIFTVGYSTVGGFDEIGEITPTTDNLVIGTSMIEVDQIGSSQTTTSTGDYTIDISQIGDESISSSTDGAIVVGTENQIYNTFVVGASNISVGMINPQPTIGVSGLCPPKTYNISEGIVTFTDKDVDDLLSYNIARLNNYSERRVVAIPSGSQMLIPNFDGYIPNNNTLEIYLNRSKLICGVDYVEIDTYSIIINVNVYDGDIIEFFVMDTIDVNIENLTTPLYKTKVVFEQLNSGELLTLPEYSSYSMCGRGLEVYCNRIRLAKNYHYKEISNTELRMDVDLMPGDYIEFIQHPIVIEENVNEAAPPINRIYMNPVNVNVPADTIFRLPIGFTYNEGYGDLVIYLNGHRLVNFKDYSEVDSRNVLFNFPLVSTDVVEFLANSQPIANYHVPNVGMDYMYDEVTGYRYRVSLRNKQLYLIGIDINDIIPFFTIGPVGPAGVEGPVGPQGPQGPEGTYPTVPPPTPMVIGTYTVGRDFITNVDRYKIGESTIGNSEIESSEE